MTTKHKIIIGDSRQISEVPNESVHLVVTSPPYWQLKDYGSLKQIGFNDSYEDYVNNLNLVWSECHRILHKGCRLCINIGDQFARSVYYGRYKIIPIRTEIIKFCETIGFDYMGAIIWQKVTTCNTTGGASVMGSYPYPRNGIVKLDYEFILLFKKHGKSTKVTQKIKKQSEMTKEEWNKYFAGHWNFPGEKQDKHLAMFPEELPKRLIKMFSFVGDTVFDPFLGSGTTMLAAKNQYRNSIGYEINKKYLSIIKEKLEIDDDFVFQNAFFEIQNQNPSSVNFSKAILKLPYVFKDPIEFNRKTNIENFKFGTKINTSITTEKYFSIKKIISPKVLVLDNDLKIRLLGVEEKPEENANAIKFLKEKTRGHKVFIKYDKIEYDKENNLFCYLYLKNKTFINAHLITNGYTNPDNTLDYKYKSKFMALQKGGGNGKRMDS